MNNKIFIPFVCVMSFVSGACLGAYAGYKYHEKRYFDEQNELRDIYHQHMKEFESRDSEKDIPQTQEEAIELSKQNINKPSILDYDRKINKMDYRSISESTIDVQPVKREERYSERVARESKYEAIPVAEFTALNGNEKITATWYAENDVLVNDETEDILDSGIINEKFSADEFFHKSYLVVGDEDEDIYGEDGVLYIRDTSNGIDYEVTYEEGEYDFGED